MSVKATVISEIQRDRRRQQEAPASSDRRPGPARFGARLARPSPSSSLDSKRHLGFDPFTESDDTGYPVTLGDFIRFYEHAAHRWRRFETGWLTRRKARTRFLWGATASVCLGHLLDGTSLGSRVADLAGRSVLIATRDQFAAALALIELDGIVRRLIVCTPDLPAEHLPAIVANAGVDVILSDDEVRRLIVRRQKSAFRLQTSHVLQHRVGAAHLRHHRRAEDGRPQLRQPDGADRWRPGTGRRRRVGHVLRHPPVWGAPDLSQGRPRPRILRALRRRRADRRRISCGSARTG